MKRSIQAKINLIFDVLFCYIAENPSTTTTDSHEAYSYLNDGRPFQHDTNVRAVRFKAKSTIFYRCCNVDDFFTSCLEINHKSGEVTLSHAGPNSIYNHETIKYRFDKSELDLSRIDFIHVSAGDQDVPICNLTINHERVLKLHPSSDDHIFSAAYHGDAYNNHVAHRSHHIDSASKAEDSSIFNLFTKQNVKKRVCRR